MRKTHKCGVCGNSHGIDKYDYVESCIGYFWIENIKFKEDEYLAAQNKH